MNDQNAHLIKRYAIINLMAVFLLVMGSTASFAQKKIIYSEKNPSQGINIIDTEITVLKQDIEWLASKINRFKNENRSVPDTFFRSMVLKEKKLNALVTLKKEYDQMIQAPPEGAPEKKSESSLPEKTDTSSPEKKQTTIAAMASEAPNKNLSISKGQLTAKIKENGLSEWMELVEDNHLLKIENSLPILFASGNASIAKEYQPFFKNLANLVKPYDVRILVEGYADTDPIHTRQYPSNFELGAARAANVVHELIKHGLKPSVFKIESTGEHRFTSGKRSEWKALERHVSLTILFRS